MDEEYKLMKCINPNKCKNLYDDEDFMFWKNKMYCIDCEFRDENDGIYYLNYNGDIKKFIMSNKDFEKNFKYV